MDRAVDCTTTGSPPEMLFNIGSSLPNDIFAEQLGLPTIWIPHSYLGCSPHAPNEHLPCQIAREALQIMTGVFWDLGLPAEGPARATRASP